MIRVSFARLLHVLACVGSLWVAVALVLWGTVRDSEPRVALIFYMSPWPILAVGAGLCACHWWRQCRRFTAALLLVACLGALGNWLVRDWQWRRPSAARGELRIVHWNVDRPDTRLAGTMRWLAAQDADVIAIAEREPRKKKTLDRWRAAFPSYQVIPSAGERLMLVRGEIVSVTQVLDSAYSFGTLFKARVRGRALAILQVDINASVLEKRGPPLGKLIAAIAPHLSEHLVVLGDFNTPRDSVFLEPFRPLLIDAFKAAGSGCAVTWPLPLPVLSLDQIWSSPTLRPVRCEHISMWRSDHRAVVADFDFAPAPTQRAAAASN